MKFGRLKTLLWGIRTRDDARRLFGKMDTQTWMSPKRRDKASGLLHKAMFQSGGLTSWEKRILGKRHPLVVSGILQWDWPPTTPAKPPGIFKAIYEELQANASKANAFDAARTEAQEK